MKTAIECREGSMNELCQKCKKEHVKGSMDWRDCQASLFEEAVSAPDAWVFDPSESDIGRVKNACERARAEYDILPDISTVRKLISHEFIRGESGEDGPSMDVQKMYRFWTEFARDMPDIMKQHAGSTDLETLWANAKIAKIIKDLKVPYIVWEQQEFSIDVRSPEQLTQAAKSLTDLEEAGWLLYHCDVVETKVSYCHRKGQTHLVEV